jgi:hypothetical protein
MDDNFRAASVRKVTAGLVTPAMVAVILANPIPIPVAKPLKVIVAIAVLELAQVTFEVMSATILSE